MQALGSYKGGCMLFLGFGAGLGSAMIVDGILEPMELAHLPYKKKTYEDYVGDRALKRLGKKKWRRYVADVVTRLKDALEADYVVLGGGNSKNLKTLSTGRRVGRQPKCVHRRDALVERRDQRQAPRGARLVFRIRRSSCLSRYPLWRPLDRPPRLWTSPANIRCGAAGDPLPAPC